MSPMRLLIKITRLNAGFSPVEQAHIVSRLARRIVNRRVTDTAESVDCEYQSSSISVYDVTDAGGQNLLYT